VKVVHPATLKELSNDLLYFANHPQRDGYSAGKRTWRYTARIPGSYSEDNGLKGNKIPIQGRHQK